MACRSIVLLVTFFCQVLFGVPGVTGVPNNYGPVETVYKTITHTSVKAVTRTLPCTPAPIPTPCAYTHDGCIAPPPDLPACPPEHDCQPFHKGSIGYGMTAAVSTSKHGSVCGEWTAHPCDDGSLSQCSCQPWGWDCLCPPVPDKTTITRTTTATVSHTATIGGGICPTPIPTAPPMQCSQGYSLSTLTFDDFFDGEDKKEESHAEPVQNPASPFEYRGFTFDPDWAFAICANMKHQLALSCNPATVEGKHYVSLYYQLRKPFISRVSRRITYDLQNDSSSWEVRSYTLTAFPKPGQIITILLCAWSIHDQDADIEPSFCHAEYFGELTDNIRRAVAIDNPNQELAFIEFTSYDSYYAPGAKKDGDGEVSVMDKGLRAVEFMLDDMVVCTPS